MWEQSNTSEKSQEQMALGLGLNGTILLEESTMEAKMEDNISSAGVCLTYRILDIDRSRPIPQNAGLRVLHSIITVYLIRSVFFTGPGLKIRGSPPNLGSLGYEGDDSSWF